jgi:hypothetical protein
MSPPSDQNTIAYRRVVIIVGFEHIWEQKTMPRAGNGAPNRESVDRRQHSARGHELLRACKG